MQTTETVLLTLTGERVETRIWQGPACQGCDPMLSSACSPSASECVKSLSYCLATARFRLHFKIRSRGFMVLELVSKSELPEQSLAAGRDRIRLDWPGSPSHGLRSLAHQGGFGMASSKS